MANRYPIEDLAEALGIELGRRSGPDMVPGSVPSGLVALADQLRISHRTACRLAADGLSERQADRYACAVGYHPAEIWPTWGTHSELPTPVAEIIDGLGRADRRRLAATLTGVLAELPASGGWLDAALREDLADLADHLSAA